MNKTDGNQGDNRQPSPLEKGHGPQGIDRAPGEETAKDTQNVVAQTQKGKNKVDGDPSKKSDQPITNERG